jgi:hypothetical protein
MILFWSLFFPPFFNSFGPCRFLLTEQDAAVVNFSQPCLFSTFLYTFKLLV